jgi:hypothetical protein
MIQRDGTSTGRRVVAAFLGGDAAAVAELLAPEAAFHSPVTDYHGRERVREVLSAVAQVVTDATASSVLDAPGQTVAFFSAKTQGRHCEGVLRVVVGPDGDVTDVTLMIRPLKSLLLGIERMKSLLAA